MKKKVLGFTFLAIGFSLLINSQAQITGAVIGVSGISSFFGLLFCLIGVLFLAGEEKLEQRLKAKQVYEERLSDLIENDNEAGVSLKNRSIPTKPRDLVHIAEKCGYILKTGRKHYKVYWVNPVDGKEINITEIPYHDIGLNLAKSILKDLAKGHGKYTGETAV